MDPQNEASGTAKRWPVKMVQKLHEKQVKNLESRGDRAKPVLRCLCGIFAVKSGV